jgi:hypothetical protein
MDQTGNVMNKQPIVLLIGCFVLGMGIQGPAGAQEVALSAGVISAGGAVSATGDNRLRSTVGARGPGILSGSDHTLYGGFWFVAYPPTEPLALPVLAADSVVTDEDVAVIVAPLENDIDPAGGPLAITSFTQPDNGIVEQIPDSQLTYTPDPDFNGPDGFTYTATNGQGGSSTAIVTVTILPVPPAVCQRSRDRRRGRTEI